jgi:hypothetical protein
MVYNAICLGGYLEGPGKNATAKLLIPQGSLRFTQVDFGAA